MAARPALVLIPALLLAACAPGPKPAPAGTTALPAAVQEAQFCAAAGEWLQSPAMTRALTAWRGGDEQAARRALRRAAMRTGPMAAALPVTAPGAVRRAFALLRAASRGERSTEVVARPEAVAKASARRVITYTQRLCLGH